VSRPASDRGIWRWLEQPPMAPTAIKLANKVRKLGNT